jgi:protein YIPF5/7
MTNNVGGGSSSGYSNDYYSGKDNLDEPSLLEELGINVEHILAKTKAVVVPFRRFHKQSALADPSMIVEDADLAGPIAFALLLGGELLLTGKLQFGYIYGFGLFGCFSMTVILNLMSPAAVSFWTVTSILGYALIPVNILAAVKILLFSWGSALVRFWAVWTVIWSTTASTRLLEIGCGMEHQRYLLAYPIALLYSAFVLITIF